jgi:hypothetical protein
MLVEHQLLLLKLLKITIHNINLNGILDSVRRNASKIAMLMEQPRLEEEEQRLKELLVFTIEKRKITIHSYY